MKLQNVYVVGGQRSPFVKSFSHYKNISTQDLMEHSFKALVQKYSLGGMLLGDVSLGAVISSSQNWNLAREVVLSSTLHPHTPAYNVQRACGTGLETAWQIQNKIALGFIDSGIAGGVDTNSVAPVEIGDELRNLLMDFRSAPSVADKLRLLSRMKLSDIRLKIPGVVEPRTGLSMGQHTEKMAKEWKISREEQDLLAFESHQKAAKAYASGFYDDLVVPLGNIKQDAFVRSDTTVEKLSKLKPAFDKQAGSITAGNATPLSDGSSCVLMASEKQCSEKNWTPSFRLVDVQVTAVNFVGGEGLLIAPAKAVAQLLERNKMKLQDFDVYEIHEAFAAQVLCTFKAWQDEAYCRDVLKVSAPLGPIDRSRLNLRGGSLALGHPFAATGARILSSLAKDLRGTKKRALISICTAGGMGIAAIAEGV